MTTGRVRYGALVLALSSAAFVNAQEANPTEPQPDQNQQQPVQINGGEPIYRIEVVARDIPAVNYFHRSGSTRIGFEGTQLLPQAKGTAKVDAHLGRTAISLDIDGLTPANGFGVEYLTYVLWAITPEGRPVNLGEVLPSGDKGRVKMEVTTNLQAFGMIVTAEPYYAVTLPSDLVVMQNVVEKGTSGVIEAVNAHFTLLPRGAYAQTAGRKSVLHPIGRDGHAPLELYEAENAVQIAEAGGAEQYAADSITTARMALKNAEDAQGRSHGDRKEVITFAREAVQGAEDARIITIRKIKAEDEAAQIKGRQDAERAAQEAQAQQQQEAVQRAQAEAAAQEAKAREETARAAREQAEAQAAQSAAQAQQAAAQAQAAQQQAQQAQQQAQAAQQQETQMRERLRQQLSQVLQTRETARGLIVNMPDVLFDFNKYTLKSEAREKLAKVSGILLAYPALKVQVEGYTDSIGSDDYNQKLSEERAGSVREYLVQQSVSDNNVTAQGFGKTSPVADNSSASGRAQNRRVELVVSGQSIGIQESQPGQPGGQAETEPPQQ